MLQVKTFVFSPIQENTYVVFNEKNQALIVDPGCYFAAEQSSLADFLTNKNLTPVQLLNTHCHLDHVFGNKWVYEKYGLALHIHEQEEKMLAFAPLSGDKWGLPFENYTGPLHFLEEGGKIILGDDELEIILAPGHSPGSLCFYSKENKFVIGGDVLFNGSIGRTDLPGGNHETLINSIKEKLLVLPDDTVVHSGHGMPTTIGREKRTNPFLV